MLQGDRVASETVSAHAGSVGRNVLKPKVVELVTRAEFFADLRSVWGKVKEQGNLPALLKLQRAQGIKTILAFAGDWLTIALAIGLVYGLSWWWLPLSLVLVGSRHRALSNLVHDASHGNLFKRGSVNDVVANLFAALAMQDTVRSYRVSHGMHHAYLGTLNSDPDAVTHLSYGFNDLMPWKKSFRQSYLRLLCSPWAWRDSFVGSFRDLSSKERFYVGMWWVVFLGILALAGGPSLAGTFALVWLLAKSTTYHAIRLFAEFLDHTGLEATSVVKFTRTLPRIGICSWLFHPHQDTFHLVHHLVPKVPHYNLKSASEILKSVPLYQGAHHCDSYFLFGKHRAIDCWSGHCKLQP